MLSLLRVPSDRMPWSGASGGSAPLGGSGTAIGTDSMSVGSGRGSWCGGHGPCTGWPATFRYSTSCGNANTVGLLPVFGAFSISSSMRGLPRLCPSDSIATRRLLWVTRSGPGGGHCAPGHRAGQQRINSSLR